MSDEDIKRIMESNEGYGCTSSSIPASEENIDDMGPEYWEDLFGGPDDSEIDERVDDEDLDEGVRNQGIREVGDENCEAILLNERKKISELISWLEKSELANPIDDGREGFFVRRGTQVIINRDAIEGLDWLLELGLGTKVTNVSNYQIVYVESKFPASERLWFLRTSHVIDLSQSSIESPPQDLFESDNDDDLDLPF